MQIEYKTIDFTSPNIELVVVPIKGSDLTSKSLSSKNKDGKGSSVPPYLKTVPFIENLLSRLKTEGFKGKTGEVVLFRSTHEEKAVPLLFVGWDDKAGTEEFERISRYRRLGTVCTEYARLTKASSIAVIGSWLEFAKKENLSAFIEGANLSAYSFKRYKSAKKDEAEWNGIRHCILPGKGRAPEKVITEALSLCSATMLSRDLINLAPCDCTPTYIADNAREVAKKYKLGIKIYQGKDLEKIGATGILTVSKGSDELPYLIKLSYKPSKKTRKTISVVGKGITFDSGGLSIKPADSMMDMKSDMSGAAAVLGIMSVVGELKPAVEVSGYIATCENMINGKATRPGDVFTTMSGKTVEVLNTDAEGRLILSDALTLAIKDGAKQIIDLATLTGACMVALGLDYAGLFSTDAKLADSIIRNGVLSGERYWRLPLAPEYKKLLESGVADMKNIGGRWGGAITAALFLKEFVGDVSWAHLDIAGPASTELDKGFIRRGGVGFGVRTVSRYILDL